LFCTATVPAKMRERIQPFKKIPFQNRSRGAMSRTVRSAVEMGLGGRRDTLPLRVKRRRRVLHAVRCFLAVVSPCVFCDFEGERAGGVEVRDFRAAEPSWCVFLSMSYGRCPSPSTTSSTAIFAFDYLMSYFSPVFGKYFINTVMY
jgi:hypothetical protein